MATTFVGLGSNIAPKENLRRAAALLRAQCPVITFSHVYRTEPQDVIDQPDFLNAVARIEVDLSPKEILAVFQEIEQGLKKAPPIPKGPRTIDLDLLLYDDLVLPNRETWLLLNQKPVVRDPEGSSDPERETSNEKLVLPHLRLHLRRFVLEPLCELLDPQTKHPVLGATWQELLKGVTDQRCDKIALRL